MTQLLFDVPGFIQGFRFSDDPLHYDAANARFLDQSPYGAKFPNNHLQITAGTPAFVTGPNGQRGLTLNNTVQGDFLPAIPWQGTVIFVWRPTFASNATIYPVIMGGAASATSNGGVRIVRAGVSNISHRLSTAGGALTLVISKTSDALVVGSFCTSQEAAAGYATEDGVTITTTSGTATTHGNVFAPAYHSGPNVASHRARFGNLSGAIGDVAASSHSVTAYALYFYAGNPAATHPAQFQALMAALRDGYGLA